MAESLSDGFEDAEESLRNGLWAASPMVAQTLQGHRGDVQLYEPAAILSQSESSLLVAMKMRGEPK